MFTRLKHVTLTKLVDTEGEEEDDRLLDAIHFRQGEEGDAVE